MRKIVFISVLLAAGVWLSRSLFVGHEDVSGTELPKIKKEENQVIELNQTEASKRKETKIELEIRPEIQSIATAESEDNIDEQNEAKEIVINDEVHDLGTLLSLTLPSTMSSHQKMLISRIRDTRNKGMPSVEHDALLKKLRGSFVGVMVNTKSNALKDLKLESTLELINGKLRGNFEMQWFKNGNVFLTEEYRDSVFGPSQSSDEIWIRINSGCYYQMFYIEKEDRFVGNYYYQFELKGFFELNRSGS